MTRYSMILGVAGSLFLAPTADAAYSLFGNATLVSPGNASPNAVRLTSSSTATDAFGGVLFTVPTGTTVSGLETLATDYMLVAGDCGGGSPRFQVSVDTTGDAVADGNIFVYLGPTPNFTDCPTGWQSTGDLLDGELRVDTSQVGGTFYDTWANAQTLVGSATILGISLVVDSSWFIDPQVFDFDNVNIDGTIYTFDPLVAANKQACKKNGWRLLARADGTTFKNQGDCIQYVNTGK